MQREALAIIVERLHNSERSPFFGELIARCFFGSLCRLSVVGGVSASSCNTSARVPLRGTRRSKSVAPTQAERDAWRNVHKALRTHRREGTEDRAFWTTVIKSIS